MPTVKKTKDKPNGSKSSKSKATLAPSPTPTKQSRFTPEEEKLIQARVREIELIQRAAEIEAEAVYRTTRIG